MKSKKQKIGTIHRLRLYDEKHRLIWAETIKNLFPTLGLNDVLDQYFDGAAYTAAHYVGLKSTGTIALADTMASHAGWTELAIYSEATRPQITWSAAASGQKVSGTLSWSIDDSGTIGGVMICTDEVISATDGILIAALDFGSSHTVSSGYTLEDDITSALSN